MIFSQNHILPNRHMIFEMCQLQISCSGLIVKVRRFHYLFLRITISRCVTFKFRAVLIYKIREVIIHNFERDKTTLKSILFLSITETTHYPYGKVDWKPNFILNRCYKIFFTPFLILNYLFSNHGFIFCRIGVLIFVT